MKENQMPFRVRQYPHQSLKTLAHYHLAVINNKVAKGNEEAIALDCTSFLIALAFTVEALVNFVGSKKIKSWKERSAYKKKIKELEEHLNLSFDETTEPHKTLWILKNIRDQMAHGKPVEFNSAVESSSTIQSLLAPVWDHYCYPEFVNHSYAQVAEFERLLLRAAGIKLGATLSSAFGYAKV
jgi:hypothetical protein